MSIEGKPDRRDFLKGLIASGVAAAMPESTTAAPIEQVPLPRPRPKDTIAEELPDGLKKFFDAPAKPRSYVMGELADARFGPPLNDYIGVHGAIPEKAMIDFRYQLAILWKRKFDRKSRAGESYSDETLKELEKLLTSYDAEKSPKMDIVGYRAEITKSLQETRRSLDLKRITEVRQFSNFDDSDIRLLGELEKKISPTTILAYALTEVMPTKGADSVRGVEVFDFLLQNAGTGFIERIPALYDNMLSFGPYQFTSHALLEAGGVRQGASVINGLLKQRQIPASVVKLRGPEHHKAAYCFAVYNLAAVIDRFQDGKSEKLLQSETLAALDAPLIAEYIAAAHHLPANARRAFSSYSDQLIRSKDNPDKKSRFDPFIGHAAAAGIAGYTNKTKGNLAALRKLHKWEP